MRKRSKNIFRIYDKCIFCSNQLPAPSNRSGEGEHVFPKSIFGFWRSYDVCEDCRQHFGDNVDHLATHNPLILDSMKILKMGNAEKYYEQLKFIGKDTETNQPVQMIRRDGNYKSKAFLSDNFIECSEKDFDSIVLKNLRKSLSTKISQEEIEDRLNKLKSDYFNLPIGGSLIDPNLGEIKRRQISDVDYHPSNFQSITPLIAKIVFISIHYFLNPAFLKEFLLYDAFKNHSRFNGSLPEFTINSCIIRKSDQRFPFHCVRFLSGGHSILVDVMFFGYVNWRCVLPFNSSVTLDNGVEPVEKLAFYLDFEDLSNRNKYLACHYPDGRYSEIEVIG